MSRGKEPTLAETTGFIIVVLSALAALSLILSPWDLFNALFKIIGIVACGFFATLGGILLLPPDKRGKTAQQLLTLFLEFVRAMRDFVKNLRKERS